MVLSRKKLKKKFRSLLAESLTDNVAKESGKYASSATEVNHELQIVRELLVTKSRRPKLLKRGKRGDKKSLPEDLKNGDGICAAHEGSVANEGCFDLKENVKDKKRKRGDKKHLPEDLKNGDEICAAREGSVKNEGYFDLKENVKDKKRKRGDKKHLLEDLKNGDGICAAREGSVPNEGYFDLKKNDKDKKRKRGEDGNQELEEDFKEGRNLEKKKKDKQKKKMRREMKLEKKGKEGVEGQEEKIKRGEIENMNCVKKIPEAVPVQVDESEGKKVYVGGIPYYSSEDDIRSFFEDCGTVTEVDCMTFPETGKFRGIAILSFKTEGAAQRALALDGSDMGGFFLKIQPYKAKRSEKSDFSPEIIAGYHRVYVGNLSWDISEDDLKQFFSDCKITSIRFGVDKETGDFKGFAHVDFVDSVSLTVALTLDQKVACGRPVRVRCAVPRKSGQTESSLKAYENKQESDQLGDGIGAEKLTKKKKRRTCYECGTPGHLSSECPQKRAAGEA